MGSEILTAIVGVVKPNFVFHLSTEKDKNIDALRMTNLPENCIVMDLVPGRNSASKVSAADLRTLRYFPLMPIFTLVK